MLDFCRIILKSEKPKKRSSKSAERTESNISIEPDFIVTQSEDLMIKGKAFYAVWDEEAGLWSKKEYDVVKLVDKELWNFYHEYIAAHPEQEGNVSVKELKSYSTGSWVKWLKYKAGLPDHYHELDNEVTFSDQEVAKDDYVSKRLPYSISSSPTPAYDELMSTLYEPEERQKLEWAIGSIFVGDSKRLQKFIVLYGEPGSGKGTVIDLIIMLFEGYYATFDAKALTSSNNSFALEAFANNPLVVVEHDSKLSKISDNTKLNSVVSHEYMMVNEKFKSAYTSKFNAFIFLGSNTPVQITDSKSGLLRRLIDVSPSGKKFRQAKYDRLKNQLKYELGGIACHCIEVYKDLGYTYYNSYKPNSMLWATNDMYNFVLENIDFFSAKGSITLKHAYTMYQEYCREANVAFPLARRPFGEELKSYFDDFKERKDVYNAQLGRSESLRSVYTGLKIDRFDLKVINGNTGHGNIEVVVKESAEEQEDPNDWLMFSEQPSALDEYLADCPAQYAFVNSDGTDKPAAPWSKCKTKLKDLDTSQLHYVQTPISLISVDFDMKNDHGEKDLELNRRAASMWKPTYAEVSKSGGGIHLSYFYDGGDPEELSRTAGPNIEIKVNVGNSALRRKLTLCNNLGIATISSGLPKKEVKPVVSGKTIATEKELVNKIKQALRKETNLGGTKSNVEWIGELLDNAYKSGISYDVSSLEKPIRAFAKKSTHHAAYCLKLVNTFKFKSEENKEDVETLTKVATTLSKNDQIVIFDLEVFPNGNLICWKFFGDDKPEVYAAKNPTPELIETLSKYFTIGYNNKNYDNHILYAIQAGYTVLEVYNLSQRLVSGDRNAPFTSARNWSGADLYDICTKKQSLKKWEIELDGVTHKELGIPWDQPVPDDMWDTVIEYCKSDVRATEAVLKARWEDFIARKILASMSGLTINDSTRMHATKFIFDGDKHPPLVYTDLSKMFPGYTFDKFKRESVYMDEVVGEGGYVYAEPGFYGDVALLDIASMHPHSIIALNLFGPYTSKFKEIVDARLAIKHHDYDKAKTMLNGALEPYLGSDEEADALASALKIVINSVYGFTTATFDNPFKDPRNVDNIVAKRGALFMVNLKHEVQKRGFCVAHIKTDSIKIPDATPEIIQFVMDYGKQYGYTFEHEATYDKMCLVNDAVYVAKYKDGKHAGEWTATGTQFQVPYVFKTLFSHEPIEFKDMCETKSVTTAMYLDYNERLPEGEHNYVFVGRVGQFCPMVPGANGGILYRKKDDKYSAVTGTKGYRWLESDVVRSSEQMSLIDHGYYRKLVDAAVDTISKYINFDWFASDEPYKGVVPFMNPPEVEEELPFK